MWQDGFANGDFSAECAHADKTPGDPAGPYNYDPLVPDNSANMYTLARKHRFDKQLYCYLDWATTGNKPNAHYNLGAWGRWLTTDCHDATHTTVIDYTSAGNAAWGGCREEAFSTGVNYNFLAPAEPVRN